MSTNRDGKTNGVRLRYYYDLFPAIDKHPKLCIFLLRI